MALKNYTTTVSVHKTLGEIQEILVAHGARKIMLEYQENGSVEAVSFSLSKGDHVNGFRIPADTESVLRVLMKQKKEGKIKTLVDAKQAERIAWRIIKDWIDAQMAILEYEMVEFEEIFMPYMLNEKGQTLFQVMRKQLLAPGNEPPS